tara:strand:+ start:703 stop:2280 length:1578 start_codon:yes stop_codon:yes gene_type:complete
MIKLYNYQQKVVDETRDGLKKGEKGVLIVAPTGAGKSVILSEIARLGKEAMRRVMVLTDRAELLLSNGGTMQDFGLFPTMITSRQKYVYPDADVYLAMSQTLKRRMDQEVFQELCASVDLLIIDEAHKSEFDFFFQDKIKNIDGKTVKVTDLNKFFKPSCKIVGLTATPVRRGKQMQLADIYNRTVEAPTVKEIISMGKLSPCVEYVCESQSMDGVSTRSKGGELDYDEAQQFDVMNKSKVYGGIIKNWQKYTSDTITIAFCVNIDHAARMAKEFCEAGISAKFLCSKVPAGYEEFTGERDAIIEQWKSGEFQVLCNANIFTTGFNYPAIETVVFARHTLSSTLWLQAIGRGSRVCEGKAFFSLLDFGNNIERLQAYDADRVWSLTHKESKAGEAKYRECVQCGAYIPASSRKCTYCGYERPLTEKETVEIELVRYSKDSLSYEEMYKRLDWNNPRMIEMVRNARGYKVSWVIRTIVNEKSLKTYGAKYRAIFTYAQHRQKMKLASVKNPKYWTTKQLKMYGVEK